MLVLRSATSSPSVEVTFAPVWLEHLHVKAQLGGYISSSVAHRFSARSAKFVVRNRLFLKVLRFGVFKVSASWFQRTTAK
ncbi:hypothetical protein CGK23_23465 [Vibrio parahaemolyticus]|nr:hypothetical protein CGK23_23465 [Vibrio parahaemolyticus]TOG86605.1 hypothetical protein CGI91_22770 [Vibrio parahaemolyticus]